MIQFDRSVLTYKIVNRQCPESLWDKYHHRTQHSSYRTENYGDLQISKNNIEYVKKGFHYSALKTWNNIPINIRELLTLNRLKNQLKSYAKSYSKQTRLPGRSATAYLFHLISKLFILFISKLLFIHFKIKIIHKIPSASKYLLRK